MTAPNQSLPLAYTPAYRPFVLHGSINWLHNAKTAQIKHPAYRFLHAQEGGITFQHGYEQVKLSPGQSALVPPGTIQNLQARGQPLR